MAMSNAERQQRYRERRDQNAPVRKYIPVEAKGRPPSRPQRWIAAVEEVARHFGLGRGEIGSKRRHEPIKS